MLRTQGLVTGQIKDLELSFQTKSMFIEYLTMRSPFGKHKCLQLLGVIHKTDNSRLAYFSYLC